MRRVAVIGAVLLALPVLSVMRDMGCLFHRTPWPLSRLRDLVFDHTAFLEAMLVKNYLKDAETQMETLPIRTAGAAGAPGTLLS